MSISNVTVMLLHPDPSLTHELQDILRLSKEGKCNIILNFSDLTSVKPKHLVMLLKIRKAQKATKRKVVLCNIPPGLGKTITDCDLRSFFTNIAKDQDTAMAILTRGV